MSSVELFIAALFVYGLSYAAVIRSSGGRSDGEEDDVDGLASATPRTDAGARSAARSNDATGPTIRCGVCGTENDAEFTYCKQCITELGDAGDPSYALRGLGV